MLQSDQPLKRVSKLSSSMASMQIMGVRGKESRPCLTNGFKFHPNYGNDVRQQYVNLLVAVANSEILSSIATQVRGIPTQVNRLNNNLAPLIAQTEYALS